MEQSIPYNEIFAWGCLILGFVLAMIGTIIPGLPGALFVVVGILIHKFLMPDYFSWWSIAIIIGLAFLSWIVDFIAGVMGAKLGGASKYGLFGAAIGGLIGIPFGIVGLFVGPFLGAVVGDIIAKQNDYKKLLMSGGGALLGFLFSLLARFFFLFLMLVTIIVNIFAK